MKKIDGLTNGEVTESDDDKEELSVKNITSSINVSIIFYDVERNFSKYKNML